MEYLPFNQTCMIVLTDFLGVKPIFSVLILVHFASKVLGKKHLFVLQRFPFIHPSILDLFCFHLYIVLYFCSFLFWDHLTLFLALALAQSFTQKSRVALLYLMK